MDDRGLTYYVEPLWCRRSMNPVFTKKSHTLAQGLKNARRAMAHGGRLMIDAQAKGVRTLDRFRRRPPFDPGKDQGRGCSPLGHCGAVGVWLLKRRDEFERRGALEQR